MTAVARITAIDRFIKGCKEDGIYTDLNAACVMAGWSNLAGALTPLKGTAPTNSGFLDADLDRGIGLKGNGSSKYLDSNRANNADGQDNHHSSVFVSSPTVSGGPGFERYLGVYETALSPSTATNFYQTSGGVYAGFSRNNISYIQGTATGVGIAGISRSSPSSFVMRIAGSTHSSGSVPSYTPSALDVFVFCGNLNGAPWRHTNARFAFYSIGSATDLALLDARVSTLMADLRAIEEAGFDRDAIGYLRAVEEADGAFLETDVKVAVNNLVAGLKSDGLWDAMASTCLLCGPRTLAGALVPLKGDAPTSYGFVEGDYDRVGLAGDGTSYLDTNRSTTDDPQDDVHLAAYLTALPTAGGGIVAAYDAGPPLNGTQVAMDGAGLFFTRCRNANEHRTTALATGFAGMSRSALDAYSKRNSGSTVSVSAASATPLPISYAVFSNDTSGAGANDPTIAFYSIGTSLDLAKMDSHISSYVTAIGAAI
jgi:hypothetical protein